MEDKKTKGLSSRCKLPPEIAMAILMEGREHPCDRCNQNRSECGGYPSRKPSPIGTLNHLFLSCSIAPEFYCHRLDFKIEVDGIRYQTSEWIEKNQMVSLFDQVFDNLKYKMKAFVDSRLK